MHLSKDHGYSIKDLYADNVKIYKVNINIKKVM